MKVRNKATFHVALGLLAGSLLLPGLAKAQSMVFTLDPLVIETLYKDVDTNSAKFQEYRDLSSGFHLRELHVHGKDQKDDRYFDFKGTDVGHDDARYTMQYGVLTKYEMTLDYNKIIHRFGNDATVIFNRTAPDHWALPQATLDSLEANPNHLDLELHRDRTSARIDLGRMGKMAWSLDYEHENRSGLRPLGTSFGFSNSAETPEPIDYDTSSAQLSGEWNGMHGGLQFGYRYSKFENQISTEFFDNPYTLSGGNPTMGAFDLWPDNDANSVFLAGRAKVGSWWMNGNFNYTDMKQDDTLLAYTVNPTIVGTDENGQPFNASDPANLPQRKANTEVKVTSFSGAAGTHFGNAFRLDFRYRYYNYDNQTPRLEVPGYVRLDSNWVGEARITVPYAYKRQNAEANFTWDISKTQDLEFGVERERWNRDYRETNQTDEDIYRVIYHVQPSQMVNIRARYTHGERTYDSYTTAAQLDSVVEPGGINNQPGLRKLLQANRNYDEFMGSAQFFIGDAVDLTFYVTGRNEDYPDSDFGLLSDDVVDYNAELGYTVAEGTSFYVFASREDRTSKQRSRQSGATLSTSPLDDWTATLDEITDTAGIGLNGKQAAWSWNLNGRWSKSDGTANLFTPPGGSPSTAEGFDNYDDVELTSLTGTLDYAMSERATLGFTYMYEDYTIDSMLTDGLEPVMPGALLLAANNGNYTGNLFSLHLKLKI